MKKKESTRRIEGGSPDQLFYICNFPYNHPFFVVIRLLFLAFPLLHFLSVFSLSFSFLSLPFLSFPLPAFSFFPCLSFLFFVYLIFSFSCSILWIEFTVSDKIGYKR